MLQTQTFTLYFDQSGLQGLVWIYQQSW